VDDLQREMARIEKRTRRYWFDDGLAEIMGGVVFLLVAGYLLVENGLRGTRAAGLFTVGFPLLIVVLSLAARRTVRAVKDRFIHPRTGFISFGHPRGHRWASAALAFVIALLVVAVISNARFLVNWIPAVEGGLFALAFLYMGRKSEIVRFPIGGLLCAIGGVVVSVMKLDEEIGAAVLMAWVGIVLVAGGTLALAAYVRRLPPREEA
jgi:hypothetical protein